MTLKVDKCSFKNQKKLFFLPKNIIDKVGVHHGYLPYDISNLLIVQCKVDSNDLFLQSIRHGYHFH